MGAKLKPRSSNASTSSHKPTSVPPKSKPKPAPPPPKETTVVTSAPAPRTWGNTAEYAGSAGLAAAKTYGAFTMVNRMNDLTDSIGDLLGDAVGSVGEGVHEMYDGIGGLANRISDGVGDSVGALSDIAPTVITIGVVLGVSVGGYQLYRMYQ